MGLPLDEALKSYVFKLTGISSHDGMLFYEVQFEPAEDEKQILYRGKVFIETESLAIGRTEFQLSTRRRRSLFKTYFTITEEMAVTGHKTGDFSIEKDNQVKFKDVLSEKVSDFRDDAFWGDYNIIEPDQSIDVIIRKIIRQLGR